MVIADAPSRAAPFSVRPVGIRNPQLSPWREQLRILAWASLIWGTVGFLRFVGMMIWVLAARQPIEWVPMANLIIPRTAYMALQTVALVELARRLRGGPWAIVRGLLALFPLALLSHGVLASIQQAFRLWIWPMPTDPFGFALLNNAIPDTVQFFGIVLVVKGLEWHRGYRAQRHRADRLDEELATAQLELLRMQLQPHFLFNSLQAISELVHVDPDRADRAIVAMGELLRHGLSNGDRPLLTLDEELSLVSAYVGIEKIRLGSGLVLHRQIPAPLLKLGVPNSILQPIVENAIHHGLRGRSGGRIELTARHSGSLLEILVEDDGDGPPSSGFTQGHGMRITAARLHRMYGDHGGLELTRSATGGAIARLWWPAEPLSGDRVRSVVSPWIEPPP